MKEPNEETRERVAVQMEFAAHALIDAATAIRANDPIKVAEALAVVMTHINSATGQLRTALDV